MVVETIIRPYQRPEEIVTSLFEARTNERHLKAVCNRVKLSKRALRALTERDLILLFVLCCAETLHEPNSRDLGSDNVDDSFKQRVDELLREIDEFFQLRNNLQASNPEIAFICATDWWPRLSRNIDEINYVYGNCNPLRILSQFFGGIFFGNGMPCPLDGGGVPASCQKIITSIIKEILSLNRDRLDEFVVECCEACLESKVDHTHLDIAIKLLERKNYPYATLDHKGEPLPNQDPTNGYAIHVALNVARCFIQGHFGSDSQWDEATDSEVIQAFTKAAEHTSNLTQLTQTIEGWLNSRSRYSRQDLKFTASIKEAIATPNLELLPNIAPFMEAMHDGLEEIDTKSIQSDLEQFEDEHSEASDGELLTEANQKNDWESYVQDALKHSPALAWGAGLVKAEKILYAYVPVAINCCFGTPALKIGSHTIKGSPTLNIATPHSASAADEFLEFIDCVSLAFGGGMTAFEDEPGEYRRDAMFKLAEALLNLNYEYVAAALLATWVEARWVGNPRNIVEPIRLLRLGMSITPEYRRPLGIALFRSFSPSDVKTRELVATISPHVFDQEIPTLSSEDELKERLGQEAWRLLPHNSKMDLLEAMKLTKSEPTQADIPFRGVFGSFGAVCEGELIHTLEPIIPILEDVPDNDTPKKLIGLKKKLISRKASLNELILFFCESKNRLKGHPAKKELSELIDGSQVMKNCFLDRKMRNKWRLIGEWRNAASHHDFDDRNITWPYARLVREWLINEGMLERLILAARRHPKNVES